MQCRTLIGLVITNLAVLANRSRSPVRQSVLRLLLKALSHPSTGTRLPMGTCGSTTMGRLGSESRGLCRGIVNRFRGLEVAHHSVSLSSLGR